ncbi:MAG: hypothetical protein EOO65_01800 [Methanosarcinales archaeon]|nr:MAG: hypothetical protein EOO65_01800 [Methanosarcinales archaeon]
MRILCGGGVGSLARDWRSHLPRSESRQWRHTSSWACVCGGAWRRAAACSERVGTPVRGARGTQDLDDAHPSQAQDTRRQTPRVAVLNVRFPIRRCAVCACVNVLQARACRPREVDEAASAAALAARGQWDGLQLAATPFPPRAALPALVDTTRAFS